ncbi:MAG: hypothetical protein SNJ82_04975 [Gemmataceae bacterium]
MRILSGLAALLMLVGLVGAEPKTLNPENNWVGIVNDEKLAKQAPESGIIADAKTFEKLWKSWRKDEKLPPVDFTKQIVVVTLSVGGPNRPAISATLDDAGDLKILARSTLIAGDAFGYSLATFDRKGIKSVNGKKVPEAK